MADLFMEAGQQANLPPWGALLKEVTGVAREYVVGAVAIPFDDELAKLQMIQKRISASRLRAESDLSKRVSVIRSSQRTPEGQRVANDLTLAASKAINQGQIAVAQVEKTINRLGVMKAETLAGRPTGATAALYAADKALSINLGAKAEALFNGFFDALTKAEKDAASFSLIGGAAAIPGAVYADIARAAGAARAKAAAWAPTAGMLLIGAAALYGLMLLSPLLPRGRR